MEIFSIVALALALLAAGCLATFVAAGVLPLSVLERARHNGRFAGLGAGGVQPGGGPGKGMRLAVPAMRFAGQ